MQPLLYLTVIVKVTPEVDDNTGSFLALETQQYLRQFLQHSVVEHFEFVWPNYKFEIEVKE